MVQRNKHLMVHFTTVIVLTSTTAGFLARTQVTQTDSQVSTESPQQPGAPKLPTPREAAQFDVTGYWVSVVTEDWAYRMITPEKGDVGSIPANQAARDAAKAWEPGHDAVTANSCKTYGAAGTMRRPGRIHITWQDERTLRLEFDAGVQTRLFHFPEFMLPFGFGSTTPPRVFAEFEPVVEPTLQGYSIASWKKQGEGKGFAGMFSEHKVPQPDAGGALMVVTSALLPGYLQRNGVPYSSKARLTEYFNKLTFPNGETWLLVTSIVDDPEYLYEPYITSTQFKREPDGTHWFPVPCGTH